MGDPAEEFAGRVFDMAVSTFDLMSIAIGDELGYYRCLAEHQALTAAELSAATGTVARYAREWLEQQAATGVLDVENRDAEAAGRRFRLAAGVATVLATPDDLNYLAPLARQLAAAMRQLPAIADSARSGTGVPWTSYGTDMRESEGDLNRPAYLNLLPEWLAALPDMQERLLAEPPARIADIGCGAAWSTIGLARGYPLVRVDGFELDAASVELARHNIVQANLSDRVRVHHKDVGDVEGTGEYDLVTVFECLHDLAYPVPALHTMRRLLAPGGCVLIADMKVADEFSAPADAVERLMYGFSLTVCLPDSMSYPDSAATGTVMRPRTLHEYAQRAGFATVETLPIDHDLWRFYRLR